MSVKTLRVLTTLTLVAALSGAGAAGASVSFVAAGGNAQNSPPAVGRAARESGLEASPCAGALARGVVCEAANRRALEAMGKGRLEAFTVVQDVRTGALVAFAASEPARLDVTSPVLPLSVSKLLLSASWWDNRQPDASFVSTRGSARSRNPAFRSRVSVHEMLVGGSDSAGRQMAVALRKSVGAEAVLRDFERYGFGRSAGAARDEGFWAELAPAWRSRLTPPPAYASLDAALKDGEWGDALSIGESRMMVTGLHVSRFLQAVGNGGVMLAPAAREAREVSDEDANASRRRPGRPTRVMQQSTALRLQAAMRDAVRRGTARSIAAALADTGWQMGGKTGSGPGPMPLGPQSDGWFAGLIFDPRGRARFTVATFVRRGGLGGGNAARVSAELARYLIGGERR